MKCKFLVVFSILFIATPSFAEVSSRTCPYTCKTQGIEKNHCKDWREGNTCYIDDLRPGSQASNVDLKRDIVMVNKNILAGKSIEISLPNDNPVDHLDAVVRRNGGSTETALSVSLGHSIEFGSKQIDQNQNHVVQFQTNGTRAEGRKLVLTANSGDVFVESIHVMTR
ncbi:MAG: hypothetical protein H6619_06655 [Deltaproteobacteria bacterium]|nr:hypothetical protein [Deltaproteobacteria bacterium]